MIRFYRISIGSGEARQYVAYAEPNRNGWEVTLITWTHEPKHASEFLHSSASRVVRHLLAKGANEVHIEEAS